MDELIKALVGLINQGSALAEPALYLFFALKFIESWALVLPFMTAIVLGYRLIALRLKTPTDKVWRYLIDGRPVTLVDNDGYEYRYEPSPELLSRLGFVRRSGSATKVAAVDPHATDSGKPPTRDDKS